MNIWHVENRAYTRLILWRDGLNTFRVTQDGIYKPLLTNGNYTLVHKKFRLVFEELHDQVEVKPVTVSDYEFNTHNRNYLELLIKNRIDPYTIKSLTGTGVNVWGFDGSLFVSEAIKDQLQKLDARSLRFSMGFSRFAG